MFQVLSVLCLWKKKQWLRKCAVEGGGDAGEILGSFWLYIARPRETRREAQVAWKRVDDMYQSLFLLLNCSHYTVHFLKDGGWRFLITCIEQITSVDDQEGFYSFHNCKFTGVHLGQYEMNFVISWWVSFSSHLWKDHSLQWHARLGNQV